MVGTLSDAHKSDYEKSTVLAVSSLTHNHYFPSFSGDCMGGKANTSVMSVLFWEAPDDGCLDGVGEPQ